MIQLTPTEARVLGVLIEKQTTTPEQYPLTLNALVNGCNQKSNRDPVLELTDDDVHDAVAALREKQLVVRVDQMGSRVPKFKHQAGETLHARGRELAILAELLVRGAQTVGELRGRASRMTPFANTDEVMEMLRALRERPEPLVKEIPPMPGSRAERYTQLLCPMEDEEGEAVEATDSAAPRSGSMQSSSSRIEALEQRVDELTEIVRTLATKVGGADPFASASGSTATVSVGTTSHAPALHADPGAIDAD